MTTVPATTGPCSLAGARLHFIKGEYADAIQAFAAAAAIAPPFDETVEIERFQAYVAANRPDDAFAICRAGFITTIIPYGWVGKRVAGWQETTD